jgi:CheY-like chemotaxis protein
LRADSPPKHGALLERVNDELLSSPHETWPRSGAPSDEIIAMLVTKSETAGMDIGSKPALRIVLVEDDDDARRLTQEVLAHFGHEVHSAAHGAAGVGLILRLQPDLALVDLGLPGLDGYGVAARVRAEPSAANVRLIAMSGDGQDADLQRSREAGFDAHLVKPVELEALTRILSHPPGRIS